MKTLKKIFSMGFFTLLMLLFWSNTSFSQRFYDFSDYSSQAGAQYANETHVLDEYVTVYTRKCHFTTDQIRVYSSTANNGYFFINPQNFYLDSISFNLGHRTDTVLIYGGLDTNAWNLVGGIPVSSSFEDRGISFGTNNYTCFKFDVKGSNQVRVNEMSIFYKNTSPQGNVVAAPSATPAAGLLLEPTLVSLASTTPNAQIYYTLDGSTPDSNSTLYQQPILISQNTTLKSIAYAQGAIPSMVSTAVYTFPASFSTIQQMRNANLNNNDVVHLQGDLTYVFRNGNYMFVQDSTSAFLVYDNSNIITTTYTEGDVIPNGILGRYTIFNQLNELVPLANTAVSTENIGAIEPIAATIEQISQNYLQYEAKLVRISNVSLNANLTGNSDTLTDGTNNIFIYDRFNFINEDDTIVTAQRSFDIVGFIAKYGQRIQIYPRSYDDFILQAPTLPTPTITVTGDSAGANSYYFTAAVTLSSSVEGTELYYTLDGTTPTENSLHYTVPFNVTQNSIISVIAVKSGYQNSNVASCIVNIDTPTVALPIFTPIAGTYADSIEVSITTTTLGAEIRYTLDGTTPTENSTLYQNPFVLYSDATINAKAFKTNWYDSEVATIQYFISNTPVLAVSPNVLNFDAQNNTATFVISATHLQDSIHITSDNIHFTTSQTIISPANGTTNIMVTFDAVASAMGTLLITSGDLSQTITLVGTATVPTPEFMPVSGTVDTLISVSLACSIEDVEIRYSINHGDTLVYSTPFVLNTIGSYTIEAIAYKANWNASAPATATYTIVEPNVNQNDTLIYSTGFEVVEGYTASNVYNNSTPNFNGPIQQQWGIVYGTVSATAPIFDSCSLQMRWYSSSPNVLGYAYTDFDLTHPTRMVFSAKNTNGLKLAVSYSTDGGNIYSTPEIFELTSNAADYEYEISETAAYSFVRVKFAIVLPETAPTSTSRVYIDGVSIYGFPNMEVTACQNPIIAPNAGNVFDSVQVSISCATDGAQIYYTLDGSEPTINSTLYTMPFVVHQTTTVKAKAFKENYEPSNVTTATYTFPTQVESIAAFKAANNVTNTTIYEITSNITFVYKNGANIFVQDSTGALLIYDNQGVISYNYTEGDVIEGGLFGSYKLYNGLTEMVPACDWKASSNNIGTIAPMEVTAMEIGQDYAAYETRLVKLENVIFEEGTFVEGTASNIIFQQGTVELICRSFFKNIAMNIPNGMEADLIGFVIVYNDDIQIAPRTNADIISVTMEQVETPVLTLVNDENGNPSSVEISCATSEADIYYTLDGTTPNDLANLYVSPIDLQVGTWAVKAIAMKEGMLPSEVAEIDVTVVEISENIASYITLYPNPVTDQLWINGSDIEIDNVEVYTTWGQKVLNFVPNTTQIVVDMEGLSAGVYLVNITTSKGDLVKKIVKK